MLACLLDSFAAHTGPNAYIGGRLARSIAADRRGWLLYSRRGFFFERDFSETGLFLEMPDNMKYRPKKSNFLN